MAYSATYTFHSRPGFSKPSEPTSLQPGSPNLIAGLNDALGVQSRMFPAVLPPIPLLDHAHDSRTAGELTGDYFDCFAMPGGSLGLAIGEVSGKGMSAALMTSVLHSMVRGIGMSTDRSLVEGIYKIDEIFSRICPEGCFASLFVAEVDPARHRLRYVNAGQEPPLLLRSTGHRERAMLLEATGPVLGLLRHCRYHQRVCILEPGDVLVAMTDGICDAEDSSGRVWGRDHLLRVIRHCDGLSARAVVEEIFAELDRATEGTVTQDDRTLWLGHVRRQEERPRVLSESMLEKPETEFAGDLVAAVA